MNSILGRTECHLLARSCRAGGADQCPKLGVERTQRGRRLWAVHDPSRTSAASSGPVIETGFNPYQGAHLSRYDA
jgi:hypothetical protein